MIQNISNEPIEEEKELSNNFLPAGNPNVDFKDPVFLATLERELDSAKTALYSDFLIK